MKALLNTYRQSPRKVRLLADMVRGKSIIAAKAALLLAVKRGAPIVQKLIDSAVANAKQNFSIDPENLFIKEITVNKGVVMKRFMPKARGSATPLRKRTSHIAVVLGIKEGAKKETKEVKEVSAPKAKKVTKAKSTKAKA